MHTGVFQWRKLIYSLSFSVSLSIFINFWQCLSAILGYWITWSVTSHTPFISIEGEILSWHQFLLISFKKHNCFYIIYAIKWASVSVVQKAIICFICLCTFKEKWGTNFGNIFALFQYSWAFLKKFVPCLSLKF